MQPGHRALSEEDWHQVAHSCQLTESQRDKVCPACALPPCAPDSRASWQLPMHVGIRSCTMLLQGR